MSGHNKWSKIKNAKEKNDQQNAKMFTKIGREIAVAVKLGGPDPNANTQLKNIIAYYSITGNIFCINITLTATIVTAAVRVCSLTTFYWVLNIFRY